VTDKQAQGPNGVPLVSIKVKLSNQDGSVLVDAQAEVQVPL
jgi:hypothetical protein